MTDEAKARILEHGEVCVRAYNQVAALIEHTSEPRYLLSNLERISIQTIPPTLPRFLSRSFPLARHRRRPCVWPCSLGSRIMNQHHQQPLATIHRLSSNILSFERNQSSVRQPAATLSRLSTMTFSEGGATTSLSHVTFSSIEFAYHYQHDHSPHFPYHFHDGCRTDCPGTDSHMTRSYSSSGSAMEDERNRTRSSPHFSFFGLSEVADGKPFEDVSKLVPANPKSSTECIMPSTLPLLNTRQSAVRSLELSQSHLNLILPKSQDASELYLRSTSTMQVVVNSGKPVLAEETIPEVIIISQSECDSQGAVLPLPSKAQGADLSMSSVFSSQFTQPTVPPPSSSSSMSLPPCPQRSLEGCGPSQAYKLYLMGQNHPLEWFRGECEYKDKDRGSALTLASSCQAQCDHGSCRESTRYSSSNDHVVAMGVKGKQGCENEDMNEMTLSSAPMFLVGGTQALPRNGFTSPGPGHSQLRRSPAINFSILRQQRATPIESLQQAYQRRLHTSCV